MMPGEETRKETFERGQESGRIDALLAEHSAHLEKINGSVERAARAEEALAEEIHALGDDLRLTLEKHERELSSAIRAVASDVRTLNEDARLRDERVEVARKTLATETERRRTELADASVQSDRVSEEGSHRFTKRQQIAALMLAVATLMLTVFGLYFSTH